MPPAGRVVITPQRDPAERERDRTEWARRAGCPRCSELPANLLAALTTALRAAAKEGKQPR